MRRRGSVLCDILSTSVLRNLFLWTEPETCLFQESFSGTAFSVILSFLGEKSQDCHPKFKQRVNFASSPKILYSHHPFIFPWEILASTKGWMMQVKRFWKSVQDDFHVNEILMFVLFSSSLSFTFSSFNLFLVVLFAWHSQTFHPLLSSSWCQQHTRRLKSSGKS